MTLRTVSRTLIVTGGQVSLTQLQKLSDSDCFDQVIGVDSGMDRLSAVGIRPDLVIGDFDSCDKDVLDAYVLDGVEVVSFPPEKNMTDTNLAIHMAVERGIKAVTVLGAMGSRMDHSIANVMALAPYSLDVDIELLDEHNSMKFLLTDCEIQKGRYDYLSLLPLTETVTGVTLTGVKYPLKNATLKMLNSLGISNEIVGESATLTFDVGLLLMIRSND